ncbi:MAG TPA: hypothetical protein VE817_03535, partial [Candidatus Acidoferrum sp.]|nr:hypothetical protein [Candidatus Acidoferrum sp.]
VQPSGSDLLDLDAIRTHLESIGESVLVAGDGRGVKVHVHGERPDEVIEFGLSLGNLSRISVENLDNQARDVREQRAAEFTGGAGSEAKAAQPRTGGVAPARIDGDGAQPLPRVPLAVVAVAAGDGLARIFESFGVASVVRGGQSDNPSTGELAAAVESVAADEVLILPNNPNVVLAARQVAGVTGSAVHVVPTRNAAEGVAALLALDPSAGADANAAAMTDAGRSLRTMQVTEAVRDAKIGGHKVKKGQTIVLGPDDGLIATDSDRQKAVLGALATLPGSFELLTLYYGDGSDLAEAEGVSRRITDARPGLQVDLVHGGQPYYRYLISVE